MHNGPVLFAEVAGLPRELRGEARRADRVDTLADFLLRLEGDQVELVAALILAEPVEAMVAMADVDVGPARTDPELTVAELVEAVARMAATTSPIRRREIAVDLLRRATVGERVLLAGASDAHPSDDHPVSPSLVFSALRVITRARVRDLRRAAMLLGSVSVTAHIALNGGAEAVEAVDVQVGLPTALYEPETTDPDDDVFERDASRLVEPMPDGERVQAHRHGDDVVLFDAIGVDVTDRHPAVRAVVRLLGHTDLVLDVIVPNEAPGGSAPFTVVDLLYDGASLIDRPFTERIVALRAFVPAELRVSQVAVETSAELGRAIRELLAGGADAVVVKEAASPYYDGTANVGSRVVRASRPSNGPPTLPSPDLSPGAVPADDLPHPRLLAERTHDVARVLDDAPAPLQTAGWTSEDGHEAALATAIEFPPYEAPNLDESAWPTRFVQFARLATAVWTVGLLVAVTTARNEGVDAVTSGVTNVSWAGVFVVVALGVSGWARSDQLVRNLKLLDGRQPTRLRCVSSWLAPFAGFALLEFTVARLEPSDVFDIRPSILIVGFALALWRPYAFIRRLLATLIKVRADALVITAYLADLVTFGLVWWSLAIWSGRSGPVTPSDADETIGALLAAVVTAGLGLLAWMMLLRALQRGEHHRTMSQQTRYEHRMLRLRGADPAEPEVWWLLVHRRGANDEERFAGADTVRATSEPTTRVEDLLDSVRARHRRTLRRLGTDESGELIDGLREQFATVLAPEESGDEGVRDRTRDGDAARDADEPTLRAPSSTGRRSRGLRRRLVPERGSADPVDPFDELLTQAGSVHIEAAALRRARDVAPEDRVVPPRLYLLETSRLAMMAASGAMTALALWLVTRLLGRGTAGSYGDLVQDLDDVRPWFVIALLVANASVAAWAWRAQVLAFRCGVRETARQRMAGLFALAVVAGAAWAVANRVENSGLAFVAVTVSVGCGVLIAIGMRPIRDAFALRSTTVVGWAIALPAIQQLAILIGLLTASERRPTIERLTFLTVLLALVSALATVFGALSTADLQDELRSAPELAVPAAEGRRRR